MEPKYLDDPGETEEQSWNPVPPPGSSSIPEAEIYFAQELATYERYRAELERDHMGKAALIRGDELIGVFKDFDAAVSEGFRRFGLEKFMAYEIGDPVYDMLEPS